ncbi:hypothetical protein ID858_18280 [Xenorhabdus sp. DI]|uniref:hypothetical protein n=1 Tax=Xenorhabdus doucetiae TaxID=351671 RepID=UPI0019854BDA|nr:hypothetical protein [Xenorhabdus sp. DI]MBD2790432.1 hypothetical protein [Xenorhabdus sp. DI]
MSKALMDAAVAWEVTKHLLAEEHDNEMAPVIRELDEMIDQAIHNAMHIAQQVSFELKQREESKNEQ